MSGKLFYNFCFFCLFIITFLINARFVDYQISTIPIISLIAGWLLIVIVRREILYEDYKTKEKKKK